MYILFTSSRPFSVICLSSSGHGFLLEYAVDLFSDWRIFNTSPTDIWSSGFANVIFWIERNWKKSLYYRESIHFYWKKVSITIFENTFECSLGKMTKICTSCLPQADLLVSSVYHRLDMVSCWNLLWIYSATEDYSIHHRLISGLQVLQTSSSELKEIERNLCTTEKVYISIWKKSP